MGKIGAKSLKKVLQSLVVTVMAGSFLACAPSLNRRPANSTLDAMMSESDEDSLVIPESQFEVEIADEETPIEEDEARSVYFDGATGSITATIVGACDDYLAWDSDANTLTTTAAPNSGDPTETMACTVIFEDALGALSSIQVEIRGNTNVVAGSRRVKIRFKDEDGNIFSDGRIYMGASKNGTTYINTATDADGRIQANLESGTYDFNFYRSNINESDSFTTPIFFSFQGTFTVSGAINTDIVVPKGRAISFNVVGSDGSTPVPDARLTFSGGNSGTNLCNHALISCTYFNQNQGTTIYTDDNGLYSTYLYDVPTLNVAVYPDSGSPYAIKSTSVAITQDETKTIQLDDAYETIIRFVDEDGNIFSDGRIYMGASKNGTTYINTATDADGRIQANLESGTYDFNFYRSNINESDSFTTPIFFSFQGTFTVSGAINTDIVVPKGRAISFNVVGSDGSTPVPDARLTFSGGNSGTNLCNHALISCTYFNQNQGTTIYTDDNGLYSTYLYDVPTLNVAVYPDSGSPYAIKSTSVAITQDETKTIQLDDAYETIIRFVDEDGNIFSDGRIYMGASKNGTTYINTATDADGRIQANLESGTYDFNFYRSNINESDSFTTPIFFSFQGTFTVSGAINTDIVVPKGRAISFNVVGSDGSTPVPDARLTFSGGNSGTNLCNHALISCTYFNQNQGTTIYTDDNGLYSTYLYDVPTLNVAVYPPLESDYAIGSRTMSITQDETKTIQLE